MTGHREVRSLLAGGLRVARGGIAHGHRDVTRRHAFARADAEPGLALSATQSPGADFPKLLHLHDAPNVVRGHDAGVAGLGGDRQHLGGGRDQAPGLLVGDGVEHDEAAHEAELAHVLHAQRTHPDDPRAGAALVGLPDVHAVGLDLADLSGHELVVVDERVLAEGPTGGVPGMLSCHPRGPKPGASRW
jgi:hypothetical protein